MDVMVRCSNDFGRVIGRTRFAVTLDDGATVADLLAVLCAQYPMIAAPLNATIPVVAGQHTGYETVLQSGQEIALLTPVSGGR